MEIGPLRPIGLLVSCRISDWSIVADHTGIVHAFRYVVKSGDTFASHSLTPMENFSTTYVEWVDLVTFGRLAKWIGELGRPLHRFELQHEMRKFAKRAFMRSISLCAN
jgi:hypothetical protein